MEPLGEDTDKYEWTLSIFPDNSMTRQHLSFSGRLQITFHQGCWEEAGMDTAVTLPLPFHTHINPRRPGQTGPDSACHHVKNTHTHTGLSKHTSSFHMTKMMKLDRQDFRRVCLFHVFLIWSLMTVTVTFRVTALSEQKTKCFLLLIYLWVLQSDSESDHMYWDNECVTFFDRFVVSNKYFLES